MSSQQQTQSSTDDNIEKSTILNNDAIDQINLYNIQKDINNIKQQQYDNNSTTQQLQEYANDNDIEIHFNITGFGEFAGVKYNPTTILIELLPDIIKQQYNNDIILDSATIIHTSAQSSHNTIQRLYQQYSNNNNIIVVFIHFGVNAAATQFAIEQYGYNNATFNVSDQDGYKPDKQIINSLYSFEQPIHTKLDTTHIVNNLSTQQYNVYESIDPGRFVCNYTYYNSLCLSQQYNNVYSLFVHVPSFDTIDQHTQLNLAIDVIKTVKNQLINKYNKSNIRST